MISSPNRGQQCVKVNARLHFIRKAYLHLFDRVERFLEISIRELALCVGMLPLRLGLTTLRVGIPTSVGFACQPLIR